MKAMSNISLPISKGNEVVDASHDMLLPHKLWATLCEHSESFFKKSLAIDDDRTRAFWEQMVGTSLHKQAVALDRDVSKVIPMKLFGDGVATTGISKSWGKSAESFMLANLLSEGSSKTTEVSTCINKSKREIGGNVNELVGKKKFPTWVDLI